jgi:hypothetical protein
MLQLEANNSTQSNYCLFVSNQQSFFLLYVFVMYLTHVSRDFRHKVCGCEEMYMYQLKTSYCNDG